jgi:hypothetical protein
MHPSQIMTRYLARTASTIVVGSANAGTCTRETVRVSSRESQVLVLLTMEAWIDACEMGNPVSGGEVEKRGTFGLLRCLTGYDVRRCKIIKIGTLEDLRAGHQDSCHGWLLLFPTRSPLHCNDLET